MKADRFEELLRQAVEDTAVPEAITYVERSYPRAHEHPTAAAYEIVHVFHFQLMLTSRVPYDSASLDALKAKLEQVYENAAKAYETFKTAINEQAKAAL